MRHPVAVLCAVAALSAVRTANAQIFATEPAAHSGRRPWGFDVAVNIAQPVHDFADNVRNAWGVGASVRRTLPAFAPLALRGDFGLLNYGNERQRVPLSNTVNRVTVEMNTSNNILTVSGGPELGARRGPVRPYVHGFVGYSYFYTESSAGDDDGGGTFARSTNFDDGGLATGGGAGIRMPLRARSTEISVDGGARYTRNGVRSYLRRGDIIDLPDGTLQFMPRVTNADFWVYYLGVSVSFGRR